MDDGWRDRDGRRRVMLVFGTRPEAIKMAPIVAAMASGGDFEPVVAVTGQHREMLDQVLDLFGFTPDLDLDIMRQGQTLTDVTVRTLSGLEPVLRASRPEAVLVQGDTTSAMSAALAAFYAGIPVGHVEAGLRTGDPALPFPEEMNRRIVTRLATWHFAPTALARANLLREGVPAADVFVTGNTVVDALEHVRRLPYSFPPGPVGRALGTGRRIILVTAHRRESWDGPLERIFEAVAAIIRLVPDIHVLVASHRNPVVRRAAARALGGMERVDVVDPLPYLPFVRLMDLSSLVLSDSGGVQEEAPTLGCPVLVLRDVTERPEASGHGVELVGTRIDRIVERAVAILESDPARHATGPNPFGDGHAADRVVDVLRYRWAPGPDRFNASAQGGDTAHAGNAPASGSAEENRPGSVIA